MQVYAAVLHGLECAEGALELNPLADIVDGLAQTTRCLSGQFGTEGQAPGGQRLAQRLFSTLAQ
ncbi:hypothetical protein D9M70_513680 [compost metagenome]